MRLFLALFLILTLSAPAAEFTANPGVLVRLWQSQDGLPSNVVRSVVQGSDGHLWMATAEGIAKFDGFEFKVIEPHGDLQRHRLAFYRVFATSGGIIWGATYQGGLFRVRGNELQRVLTNLRSPNPPLVSQLIEDQSGKIFFKRGGEIKQITPANAVVQIEATGEILQRFEDDLKAQRLSGRSAVPGESPVLKDRVGRVWTAGVSGGLTVTDETDGTVPVNLPQYNQAYQVNELMEDSEGNVWVASPVHGLARVRHGRVDVLDTNVGENERAVSAVLEDRSGFWWIANRRGGLNRWADGKADFVNLSSRPAAAIFEDRDARLWVASRDGSVFLYREGRFHAQFTKTQVPSKVRSIAQSANGVLWFGGTQGLSSLSGETVRRFDHKDGVDDLDFSVLQPFPGGKVIAGTTAGTILFGNDSGFKVLASPEVMKHQWISGIVAVSQREVWVTTLGSGLYLWNGERWICFDSEDGLPDSRLTCVLDDGKGYLWFGSLGGIIRAQRNELLARARTADSPVEWLRLDHTDGLPSRECIGGFQPAGWKGKDGLLWFPTSSGIARVRPGLIKKSKIAPPVYLQSVRANGILNPVTQEIITEPGRARLEFRFVGLSLSAPEKVTYRARLAGLDDAWRELGTQRVAAFEAVPPGKYTFEVVAVSGDGQRSETPARLPITIEPHFWETSWFFLFVGGFTVVSAVGIGWGAARMKMKSRIQLLRVRNAREGERSRIARDLHDDLGANLTEISILAALAAEDAGKTSLQPSLDQLSVKAKQVVGSLDEIVWAVNPREDTLRSLVDYLAAFAREFLDIARIALRTDIALEIPEIPLGTQQRHGVFLAAKEALNNIVKHSKATEVQFRIRFDEEVLEMCISDNGIGFELDETSGGNGLGNLRTRMQEAGGDCSIETKRRGGTTVFLTLPLIASAKTVF